MKDTIAHIRNQAAHHKTRTFQEELIGVLKAHGIDSDDHLDLGFIETPRRDFEGSGA